MKTKQSKIVSKLNKRKQKLFKTVQTKIRLNKLLIKRL